MRCFPRTHHHRGAAATQLYNFFSYTLACIFKCARADWKGAEAGTCAIYKCNTHIIYLLDFISYAIVVIIIIYSFIWLIDCCQVSHAAARYQRSEMCWKLLRAPSDWEHEISEKKLSNSNLSASFNSFFFFFDDCGLYMKWIY